MAIFSVGGYGASYSSGSSVRRRRTRRSHSAMVAQPVLADNNQPQELQTIIKVAKAKTRMI